MLYIMEETALPMDLAEGLMVKLPEEEQELLSRRKNERFFSQSLAARALLWYGLQKEYGLGEFPDIKREEKGKPYFPAYPEIQFNYSHSDSGVLVGISREPIGVDIQNTTVYRENVAKRVAHPEELRLLGESQEPGQLFTKLWCLKEAYVKYLGTGIRFSLGSLDFSEMLKGKQPGEGSCALFSGEGYSCGVWTSGEIPALHIIKSHQLSI